MVTLLYVCIKIAYKIDMFIDMFIGDKTMKMEVKQLCSGVVEEPCSYTALFNSMNLDINDHFYQKLLLSFCTCFVSFHIIIFFFITNNLLNVWFLVCFHNLINNIFTMIWLNKSVFSKSPEKLLSTVII